MVLPCQIKFLSGVIHLQSPIDELMVARCWGKHPVRLMTDLMGTHLIAIVSITVFRTGLEAGMKYWIEQFIPELSSLTIRLDSDVKTK